MIEHYSFGTMTVNGQSHDSDLTIIRGEVNEGWWRKNGHRLDLADLIDIIAAQPDVIIIGTGSAGAMRIPESVRSKLAALTITLIATPTAQAAQQFNHYHVHGENVAGGFHLTC